MLNRSTIQIPNDFWQARWWTCWANELQRKKTNKQMNKRKNRGTESTADVLDASMDTLRPVFTLLCSQTFWKLTGDLDIHVTSDYMQKFKLPTMLLVCVLGLLWEENNWGSLLQPLPTLPGPEPNQPLAFAQAACGAGYIGEPTWFVRAVQILDSLKLTSYYLYNSNFPFPAVAVFWRKFSKIFTFSLTYAVNYLSKIKLNTAGQ